MRLRLGLLRDVTDIDRQNAKDAAETIKKNKQEAAQTSTKDESVMGDKPTLKEKEKEKDRAVPKQRIRPLSEAKAIDSGANFISESFLFFVAGSLIVFEAWRSRRKENNRREDVADRLAELEESERNAKQALVLLEKEVLRLRAESGKHRMNGDGTRILPREIWEEDEDEGTNAEERKTGFWRWLRGVARIRKDGGNGAGQEHQHPEKPDTSQKSTSAGSMEEAPQASSAQPNASPIINRA